MQLTAKDSIGLVLVGGTVAVLLVHGRQTHQDTHLSMRGLEQVATSHAPPDAEESPAGSVLAFVDVNVLPTTGDEVLLRQVVVLRDGIVTAMGPVGSVDAPKNATLVHGNGSAYLVPGYLEILANEYAADGGPDARHGVIARGMRADVFLVDVDPRVDATALRLPRGAVAKGAWYDRGQLSRIRFADGSTP